SVARYALTTVAIVATIAELNATNASARASCTKSAAIVAKPAPNQIDNADARRRASKKNTATPTTPTNAEARARNATTSGWAVKDRPASRWTNIPGATINRAAAENPSKAAIPSARCNPLRELSRVNFGKNAVATARGKNVAAFVIVEAAA